MRLHGWCEKCHKFKMVRVSSSGMAMMSRNNVPSGWCTKCEDDEERRRKERR